MKRTPITALELQLYLDGIIDISEPSFLLTFDDGYADILDALAYAIQKNIKPLVFILSDPKKVSRRELDNPLPLLDNHQLTSLVRSGCDIGSHGATHSRLTLLPLNLAKTEISASKTTLENLLGCPVNYFSFPKGSYTPQLIKTVRDSGYKLSFSMDDKIISPGTDPYNIPRIGVNGTHDFEEFTWLDTY
ncbi:MAG TPA: polysaccharide deacetylase family protein, partial [Patescibacteria group bacterium]